MATVAPISECNSTATAQYREQTSKTTACQRERPQIHQPAGEIDAFSLKRPLCVLRVCIYIYNYTHTTMEVHLKKRYAIIEKNRNFNYC